LGGFFYVEFYFRGKKQGHDLDILVTHPISGEEKGLLERILENLS
jgi:hypothetical protein